VRRARVVIVAQVETCRACKEPKPAGDFPVMGGYKSKRCRACVNAAALKGYHERMKSDTMRKWYRLQANARYAKKREGVA
jgi:hypothetical protein